MKKVQPAVLHTILLIKGAKILEKARKNQWRYYAMK